MFEGNIHWVKRIEVSPIKKQLGLNSFIRSITIHDKDGGKVQLTLYGSKHDDMLLCGDDVEGAPEQPVDIIHSER